MEAQDRAVRLKQRLGSVLLNKVSRMLLRVAITVPLLLSVIAMAGCSDGYSQEQLDANVVRAEEQAKAQGFVDGYQKGVGQGEQRALARAGLAGADGWFYLRMDRGRLPDTEYESSPLELNRAVHLCDFSPRDLCSVDPRTGESLSYNGGE